LVECSNAALGADHEHTHLAGLIRPDIDQPPAVRCPARRQIRNSPSGNDIERELARDELLVDDADGVAVPQQPSVRFISAITIAGMTLSIRGTGRQRIPA
jgi:hypothetical protein